MKNSVQTYRTLSRRPTGHSAVSLRVLTRRPTGRSAVRPTGHSAVGAYGYSAVTHRVLSRQRTAEYPCKHGYSALIFQHRYNLSAPTQPSSTDMQQCLQHSYAASCAALRRGLAEWLVSGRSRSRDKDYRGVKP